jgi:hypothetical protein
MTLGLNWKANEPRSRSCVPELELVLNHGERIELLWWNHANPRGGELEQIQLVER